MANLSSKDKNITSNYNKLDKKYFREFYRTQPNQRKYEVMLVLQNIVFKVLQYIHILFLPRLN